MFKVLAVLALSTLGAGCGVHRIAITPDVAQLGVGDHPPIERNVGYVISPEDRSKAVTTPGGSGEWVLYYPYAELEPGLVKVLSGVFKRAYPLESASDQKTIAEKGITLVFVPLFETTSSSGSSLTWPPTKFSVTIDCRAVDVAGTALWEKRLVGNGEATFSDFFMDYSVAARRAGMKVLSQLQAELNAAFRGPSSTAPEVN